MNNNPEDVGRLLNQLIAQKRKDNKVLLQIEIAKATDRTVKQALQKILDDIERKERRDMLISIVVLIVFLLGALFFFMSQKR